MKKILLWVLIGGGIGYAGWLSWSGSLAFQGTETTSVIRSVQSVEQQQEVQVVAPQITYDQYLVRAEQYVSAYDLAAATGALKSAIDKDPLREEAYNGLVEVYSRLGEADKIRATITQMEQLFEESPATKMALVRADVLKGDLSSAARGVEQIETGTLAMADLYKGVLLSYQNNHEGAQEIFNGLVDGTNPRVAEMSEGLLAAYEEFGTVTDGKDPHLFALLAKTLIEYSEHALGREMIDVAIKEDPDYTDAWIIRGFLFLQSEQPEKAVRDLARAHVLDAARARATYLLGVAYREMGDRTKSIEYFEKTLALPFEFREDVLWQLVELYAETNNPARQVARYKDLLAFKSDIDTFAPALQVAIEVLNKPALALEITDKLVEQNAQDPRALAIHAWAQIANDQLSEASTSLETAFAIDPEHPIAWLNKGLLSEQQGDLQTARVAYKNAWQFAENRGDRNTLTLAQMRYNILQVSD